MEHVYKWFAHANHMQWGDQPVTPKGGVTDRVGHGVISKGQVNSSEVYMCTPADSPAV